MKLMSLESFLVLKRVTWWADEMTTMKDVLERVLPHMGDDLVPFEQPTRFYDCHRFRTALVASGFVLAEIDAHDLEDMKGHRRWLDPNVKADLQFALEHLNQAEVPSAV